VVRPGSLVLALALAAAPLSGCAPRPRTCAASHECASQAACVAGRCQPTASHVKPAIDNARRIVVHPVDAAYLRRGDAPEGGGVPPLFALGVSGARLLLRFEVALPRPSSVVEAYLVLTRADVVDHVPAPISLHATRIVEPWTGGSTSWARQPRVEDWKTPATIVLPGGPRLVRLDVRDLVRQWTKLDGRDHGLGVVSGKESASGTAFAFSRGGDDRLAADTLAGDSPAFGRLDERSRSSPDVEPYLELYLR
jgi:hypothetical protein